MTYHKTPRKGCPYCHSRRRGGPATYNDCRACTTKADVSPPSNHCRGGVADPRGGVEGGVSPYGHALPSASTGMDSTNSFTKWSAFPVPTAMWRAVSSDGVIGAMRALSSWSENLLATSQFPSSAALTNESSDEVAMSTLSWSVDDTTVLIGFSSSKVNADDATARLEIRMMRRERKKCEPCEFLSLPPELLGSREVVGFNWRRFGVWPVVKMPIYFHGVALSASGGWID
ncbi:hypothetical protein Acr_12g0010540 [Actinidia rufa]|uniref:Uncharacterized protein n=1 Tax=Actinidia rufa TaxID=165716 RepID=A0A7J0FIW5_9ERIC|nr:hypothetical protein Acr_12g0010540 [Actinidia rufa]